MTITLWILLYLSGCVFHYFYYRTYAKVKWPVLPHHNNDGWLMLALYSWGSVAATLVVCTWMDKKLAWYGLRYWRV